MFSIDVMSRTPVYEQIVNQVEKYVSVGLLQAGAQLPSVRSLSMELSVNPNTIQKAFGELLSRGIIISVPGRGSFISNDAINVINSKNKGKTSEFSILAKKLLRAGISADELKGLIDQAEKEANENVAGGEEH